LRVLVTINCHGVDASAQGGLDLARMLVEKGNEVLVQAEPGTPVSQEAGSRGFETGCLRLRKKSFPGGLLPFRKLVRQFRPEAICSTRADGQTAAAITASGIPLVRIRCDIRKPASGRLWRFVDNRTDLVVFPSRFMRDRGYAGDRTGRVEVIPQPVNTHEFHTSNPSLAEGKLLVSIGRLSPMKGHRTLIRALALLPEDVSAVIAGPPSQQSAEELRRFAEDNGVGDKLSILGRVDDVREIISRGTAGVVTSLGSEVISRAGMEMMSMGLPVLAAATNGLLDLVKDGRTGFFHSPGNHRQLASQAEFLLLSASLLHRMGRAARKSMVDDYSFEAVGEKWEEILKSLT
jgi:glycosyltransferase involved in cell wall biosynthesis